MYLTDESTINQLANLVAGDFPGLNVNVDNQRVTYLDNAATTLKPKAMVDAISEYYLGISSNVHRGKSYMLEVVSSRFESCRYKVAELINCSGNEVVMLSNTTAAINLVATGLNLTKEDKVLVLSDAHHSNLLPWMKHASVDMVKFTDNGMLDMDHFHQLLKQSPKVVAINHCSNVTGIYHPLEEMAKAAKAAGAFVVVDAAQSIPHRKIDVRKLDIDFLAFSAHKMAGPTGVGILYGRKDMLETLDPMSVGGGMVDWVDTEHYRLRKIPHRYEAGTPDIAGAYGFGATLDYLNKIGFEQLEKHDREMSSLMLNMAQERDYLQVIGNPNADRGAVLSLGIKQVDELDDIARILSDTYGIVCRHGHLCAQPFVSAQTSGQVLRVSAYMYNTSDDVRSFFAALDEIGPMFFL